MSIHHTRRARAGVAAAFCVFSAAACLAAPAARVIVPAHSLRVLAG
jgi:hypothetical protein